MHSSMKATGINVFEGARRISLLIKIVWVLGCTVALFMQTPSVSLTYQAELPSAPFQLKREPKITTRRGSVFNSMQEFRDAIAAKGGDTSGSDQELLDLYQKEGQLASVEYGQPVQGCEINDGTEYKTVSLDEGKTVSIQLCFKAYPFENGRMLVPYHEKYLNPLDYLPLRPSVEAKAKGEAPSTVADVNLYESRWWGDEKYSANVTAYTTRRSAAFVLPKEGQAEALKLWRREWWSGSLRIVGVGVGGWLMLSIITSVIGWIVRGFFGIPSGKDKREPAG